MSVFTCPFCSAGIAIDKTNIKTKSVSFEDNYYDSYGRCVPSCLRVQFIKCPNCEEYTIKVYGDGSAVSDIDMYVRPTSLAANFPDYVPKAIRQDYKEAYSIVNLSPKASAVLARRCLQGMIHDFWGIRKNNLADSIKELKDLVSAEQWGVINAVRQLGNIGAHMEKDVDVIVDIEPQDAEELLKLIEYLIEEWYINRHKRENLFLNIQDIAKDKQNQRGKPN